MSTEKETLPGEKRVLLTIAYEGTAYCGFQRQDNGPTIQEELEKALLCVTGETISLTGGSRTDAGVHAKGNVAVFDTKSRIPGDKFSFALNRHLPGDIRVMGSEEVPSDFHPHRIPSIKTYEYRILTASIGDPLRRNFVWQQHRPLDLEAMERAAGFLVGEHDFSAFCSAGSQVQSKVRRILSIEPERREDEIRIRVRGNGFLYNMVRIIAGTLVEVGLHRLEPEKVREILEGGDRGAAGPTAPAGGLTLVGYEFIRT